MEGPPNYTRDWHPPPPPPPPAPGPWNIRPSYSDSDPRLIRCILRPTCLFLAAKTTNYPVPIDQFIPKFAKLSPADVLDTEFTVAQSLGFEFWVRGAEKALRGWTLEFQVGSAHIATCLIGVQVVPRRRIRRSNTKSHCAGIRTPATLPSVRR